MLDLIISYINYIILSIRYFIKKIVFQPPNPKTYKIVENPNNKKNNIEIYIKCPGFKNYHRVKKKVQIDIEFKKIPDRHKNFIPIFIFKPKLSLYSACIIYCHGNSCDIGSTFNECCDLAKLTKCIIISFDYPGYGIYQNVEPSEKDLYETVQIIYEYVKKKLNFNEKRIIVYGFSLGTGVAFDLACRRNYNFAGLILQSPFLSIFRTLYNTKKTKYFDLFNNCDKAKYLNIKTLFIQGNKDEIVPYVHGRILSKLIPKNKLYYFQTINGAGHNDIFSNKNLISLSEIMRDFIENCCNSDEFKDNKTTINKKMNNMNYNFKVSYNNNSFSKFVNGNNIFNTSINERRKIDIDINNNEIENKSFSENNSAFLIRKKESFFELLGKSKNDEESNIINTNSKFKTLDEETNELKSGSKLLKSKSKFYKNYINEFSYTNNNESNQTNIMDDKSYKNSIINDNEIKTVNFSDSNISQKNDFSEKEQDYNIIEKKGNKISLEQILNISNSE